MKLQTEEMPAKITALATQAALFKVVGIVEDKLGIKMQSDAPLSCRIKGRDYNFDLFFAVDNDVIYRLISNRSDGILLCDKYKNFDYFLLISDTQQSPSLEAVKNILQSVDDFLAVYTTEACSAMKRAFKDFSF